MKQYERLLMKRLTLAQDSISLSIKIKRLTEERKAINKQRKVLERVLTQMRGMPMSTFLDNYTSEELDEQLRKGEG